MNLQHDFDYMTEAVQLARKAQRENEVPVGAIIVLNHEIIGRGYNSVINTNDPTAHAEIIAIRDAAKTTGNYRLTGAELFVTLEPCLMCYTAMVHARIKRLVFAASDPKSGTFSTGVFNDINYLFNHKVEAKSGTLSEIASNILSDFFQTRRGARAVEWGGLENR